MVVTKIFKRHQAADLWKYAILIPPLSRNKMGEKMGREFRWRV